MFGTFQKEEEQAIYGITKPVNSYNPIYLVFHAWMDVIKDVYRSKNLKEILRILFGSPVAIANSDKTESDHEIEKNDNDSVTETNYNEVQSVVEELRN